MCMPKAPKVPPPPPPPPPPPEPPKQASEPVKRARAQSRTRARSLAGDQSTILTSAKGLLRDENKGKTLLGG